MGDIGLVNSYRKLEKILKNDLIDDICYMSPEQLKSLNNNTIFISYSTDLFSAASILYEMATLEKAFNEKTTETLVQSIVQNEKSNFQFSGILHNLNPILEQYS